MFEKLKEWATSEGHAADSAVHLFIAKIEGKIKIEEAKALLEAAGYKVTAP